MRARNLKPGFFKNEQLAELPPEARLLFAGLWCMADREGYLEDRPKRIKIELFPGDSFDVDSLLAQLHERRLIERYEAGGVRCIRVMEFLKHQHPHQKEPPSTLPKSGASPGLLPQTSIQSPVQAPDKPADSTSVARLNPSSLNPESGILNPTSGSPSASSTPTKTRLQKVPRGTDDPEWFLDFKLAYPDRAGDQKWRAALSASRARIAEGHSPSEFIAGAIRYAEYLRAGDKLGTEYVKQAATFLGPDKPFLQPWTPAPSRAERRFESNADVARQFAGEHREAS